MKKESISKNYIKNNYFPFPVFLILLFLNDDFLVFLCKKSIINMKNEEINMTKTWFIEENEFFSQTFLGKEKTPDQGFFIAIEGLSTEDGRVFCNLFNTPELEYYTTSFKKESVNFLIELFKETTQNKEFINYIINNESEHGLVVWKNEHSEELFDIALVSSHGPIYAPLLNFVQNQENLYHQIQQTTQSNLPKNQKFI